MFISRRHAGAGLAPHFDDHDAFILQLEGSKEWRLYGFAAEQPLRGRHFDIDASLLGEPSQTLCLEAGDLLYVPRGLVHQAHATDTSSLHLTLGVSLDFLGWICFKRRWLFAR